MKLLLTSAGFTNPSIVSALVGLTGKPLDQTNLVFVPTAANGEAGDKDWLIDDLYRCKSLGFQSVDIVDIAALRTKEEWLPRFLPADVLLFGGGNTFYLLQWLEKSGVAASLPELLEARVYVGISAGSIAASREVLVSSQQLFSEEVGQAQSTKGLGFVGFQFRPHLNSPYFPKATKEFLTTVAEELGEPLYALDDQSALVVRDGNTEVVSEGEWTSFNV